MKFFSASGPTNQGRGRITPVKCGYKLTTGPLAYGTRFNQSPGAGVEWLVSGISSSIQLESTGGVDFLCTTDVSINQGGAGEIIVHEVEIRTNLLGNIVEHNTPCFYRLRNGDNILIHTRLTGPGGKATFNVNVAVCAYNI